MANGCAAQHHTGVDISQRKEILGATLATEGSKLSVKSLWCIS